MTNEKRKVVLLTGATPQQVGSPVVIGYVAISAYVRWGLEEAGYEVEQRAVVPGEAWEPGRYDAVVCGLAPIRGNPARHTYGMLWARRMAREAGVPLVYYVDDWQFPKIRREAVGQARTIDTNFFSDHKRMCRGNYAAAVEVTSELRSELTDWAAEAEREDWAPVVYPAWSWGDASIVRETVPTRELRKFDPGAWAYEIAEHEFMDLQSGHRLPHEEGLTGFADLKPPLPPRERRWVMAVLSDQEAWLKRQGFEWPVAWYGGKGPLGKVSEREVRRQILGSWGVLSPGYVHSGSGWWRVRAFDAVCGGAIWHGGIPSRKARDTEMAGMPDPSAWDVARADIERMRTGDLERLVERQRASLEEALVPKAEAARVWTELLE